MLGLNSASYLSLPADLMVFGSVNSVSLEGKDTTRGEGDIFFQQYWPHNFKKLKVLLGMLWKSSDSDFSWACYFLYVKIQVDIIEHTAHLSQCCLSSLPCPSKWTLTLTLSQCVSKHFCNLCSTNVRIWSGDRDHISNLWKIYYK